MAKILPGAPTDNRAKVGEFPGFYPDARDLKLGQRKVPPEISGRRESGPHLQKPSIEGSGLLRIAPPFQLDTMADFGEHEHARPNVIDRCARDPMDNVWMGAVALADFGNDVRVHQNFTDQPGANLVDAAGQKRL
jgi:hypothetical protein